jgi:hypothetical protein
LGSFRHRWLLLLTVLVAAGLLASCALQSRPPAIRSASRPWGSYSWQVDQATSSLTFVADATFTSAPGLVQIPVPLSYAATVRHIQGSVSLSVPTTGVNGSIIALLRDQNGNAIAAVKMQQFGDATATVPINATLSSDLSVTSLQLLYYIDEPGTQIVHMSFVMN